MPLTRSQQKALSTDRHLAIMANAGSGKTRVLVHRYVNLFEEFPLLTTRNVAAITFTENAASELRERIVKEIKERLESTTDPAKRARLRDLRESLRNAFIGTIHSFALRILKEYPVEAGIDAGFTIVTGADVRLLQEEALERVFYSVLEDAYQKEDSKTNETNSILQLFRTHGRSRVRNLVRSLLNNRQRSAGIEKSLLKKREDEILMFWNRKIEEQIVPLWQESKNVFVIIQEYVKSGNDGIAFNAAINGYFRSSSDFFEKASALKQVLESLLTEKYEIRKRVIDINNVPTESLLKIEVWLSAIRSMHAFLLSLPASKDEFYSQHREYLDTLRTVFELYSLTLTEYANTKSEYGLLDFDDLIEKLLAVLDNMETRTALSEEFKFVMIDEYQDTDESQFEIAKRLTDSFGTQTNIAIVGDPKQSIYTFRNADPEVFHTTRRAIGSHLIPEPLAVEAENLTPAEVKGHIDLGESFRMARAPLALINKLFRTLLANPERPYSELIHARETDTIGSVEWICPDAPKRSGTRVSEELSSEEEASETDLIAKKICSLNAQETPFGDIAILLRSRTRLMELERALTRHHIPYAVTKGSGFFEQQEILDITSYLSFLISQENDIALAALLRSPFFGLSDVELLKIAYYGASVLRHSEYTASSLWANFQHYVADKGEPYLQNILVQIRENIALAGRTEIVLLIEKIFAETGIFTSLGPNDHPEQAIANLRKFLALARASDQSSFSGLFDFVERISYLRDSDEQESQAELPTESGAVRIMTVHAAKGLEFPIVILPFLQRKVTPPRHVALDKELGLEIPTLEGNSREAVAELIAQRAKEMEIEEEKRILYVAMTRAKDHLILSSTIPKNIPRGSWLGWISESLGSPLSGEIIVSENILHYDSASTLSAVEMLSVTIPLIRSESDIPAYTERSESEPPAIEELFVLDATQSHTGVRTFSATELTRLHECPTKYYLRYVLGMPESAMMNQNSISPASTIAGTLVGQIVHRLAEQFEHIAPAYALSEERFQNALESIFNELFVLPSKRETIKPIVRTHLANFLGSAIAGEVMQSPKSMTEFPLRKILDSGDSLYGILDRLFLDRENRWTILDFKTDSVPNPEIHRFQLEFYADLVHGMTDATSVRAILFFTATGEAVEFMFTDFSSFEKNTAFQIKAIQNIENVPTLEVLPRNIEHCSTCHYFIETSQKCIADVTQKPTEIPAR